MATVDDWIDACRRQGIRLRRRGREHCGPSPICQTGDDRFWIKPGHVQPVLARCRHGHTYRQPKIPKMNGRHRPNAPDSLLLRDARRRAGLGAPPAEQPSLRHRVAPEAQRTIRMRYARRLADAQRIADWLTRNVTKATEARSAA